MEKQEFAASSSLKTLHPFIDNEDLLRVWDDYNKPRFLTKQCIR